MKRLKYLGILLATGIMLAGCGKSVEINVNESYQVVNEADYSGKDFISVAKGQEMELLLQPSTGTIRWKNSKTGEYADNRISPDDISNVTALSDVVANYFNGSNSKKYNSTASMDSYTYGIESETLKYETMDNGVRFIYNLGSDDVTYKMFPAYISDERMQTLILEKLEAKQQKAVKAQYRQLASGAWARKTNKDNPLSGLAAPQLYDIFYNVCGYTFEDLEADCEEWETLDELPENQNVELVMEYYLDGDDLMVRIPTKNIISGSEYPIESLEVLPYFMASNSKDGYIFVPDGSGALIYLDNDRLTEYQFTARYFGGDIIQDVGADTYNASSNYMPLPVYGIKADNHAVLGIIESGAEIAKLTTYLSGYYSGIDYARASLRFYIRESQTLSSYVGATNNYTMSKASTDYFHDDIVLRYCFLTGDNANYTGMAKAYQKRLIDQNNISVKEPENEAPLFLDLLGEIDKELYFVGIPYKSSISLTSFNEAQEILQDITSKGVSNIKVQYEGIVNGGLDQRAASSIKISSKLGGASEYKKLSEYAANNGIDIFPSVLLQTAFTDKHLSKVQRSYTLAGELAEVPIYDLIRNTPSVVADYPEYIISPNYIYDYVLKFKSAYSKINTNNLASSDFMTFMSPDYRNGGNVSITTGKANYLKAQEALAENYTLMLNNPIALGYKVADYITNLPMKDSSMKILDASVPFTQMVLEGCLSYSNEYVNRDNESLDETLMRAIEGKSSLNFRFIAADTSMLTDTTRNDVFFAEYRLWKNDVVSYYEKYNEFYQLVKNASIVKHEIIDRNNDLRVVTYSNGVKVYLNYGEEAETIDGKQVNAMSYIVEKGGMS